MKTFILSLAVALAFVLVIPAVSSARHYRHYRSPYTYKHYGFHNYGYKPFSHHKFYPGYRYRGYSPYFQPRFNYGYKPYYYHGFQYPYRFPKFYYPGFRPFHYPNPYSSFNFGIVID